MKDPSGGITVLCDRISPCMKLQEPGEALAPGLKLAGATNLGFIFVQTASEDVAASLDPGNYFRGRYKGPI